VQQLQRKGRAVISAWQTVWVTGASQGIGRALAMQLARAGGTLVAVSSRSGEDLDHMKSENPAVLPFVLDVTDQAAAEEVVGEIETTLGLPELVVLNAGTYEPVDAATATVGQYRRHMEVNYMGVINCIAAVLPRMLARGHGQLVIMGSVAGYRGLPQAAAYGPTKAALISLAETLRLELHGTDVDVRLVNPGFVATRLTDKNRFSMPAIRTPAQAAAAIIKGLQGSGFEVVFPWRFVFWLKLARLLPYRLYFYLAGRLT
jgi:short-subunit dehydrogenase